MRPAEFSQKNGFVEVTVYKKQTVSELIELAQKAHQKNDWQKAIDLRLQIAALQEQIHGFDSEQATDAYANLAHLYFDDKNYAQSLFFRQKVVVILKKTLPLSAELSPSFSVLQSDLDNELKKYRSILDNHQNDLPPDVFATFAKRKQQLIAA